MPGISIMFNTIIIAITEHPSMGGIRAAAN
jgi:hypothetical protein